MHSKSEKSEAMEQYAHLRGAKVRIKRWAKVKSTHPKRKQWMTVRAQTVTVSYLLWWDAEAGEVSVCWAGSGGYWCETPVKNVEVLPNESGVR